MSGSSFAIGEIKNPRVRLLEEFDVPDCTNFPFNVICRWVIEKLVVSTIGFKTGAGVEFADFWMRKSFLQEIY